MPHKNWRRFSHAIEFGSKTRLGRRFGHWQSGRAHQLRLLAAVVTGFVIPLAYGVSVVRAADSSGYYYGTDSNSTTYPSGSPYQEPGNVGGNYGGYVGEIGTWQQTAGCTNYTNYFNTTDASAANSNYNSGIGVGVGGYFFMGGPGADPNYNGTASEATAWGAAQAKTAVSNWDARSGYTGTSNGYLPYEVVWMDIEGSASASNGWDGRLTNCGATDSETGMSYVLDRDTFNGFWNYIVNNTAHLKPGAYSSGSFWNYTFTPNNSPCNDYPTECEILNTWEWTYENDSGSVLNGPQGWTQTVQATGAQVSASFFGGQSRGGPYNLGWQWCIPSACGGSDDYDQLDQGNMASGW